MSPTTHIPFVTVPIVPTSTLTEDDFKSFVQTVTLNGDDPSKVLSSLASKAIKAFNLSHATKPAKRGKTIRKEKV